MPGPNSAPNGDSRLVAGSANAEILCDVHTEKCDMLTKNCKVVTLREYLARRKRLITGKTR